MSSKEIDRKIAVIFVADVVGYSKHMEKDENATFKAYGECETILNKLLEKYKGSIFNTAGDSVLAEFPSAVNAVECAVDFQNELKKRNDNKKTEVKLEFRIGINMGDVVMKDGNLLGDGVNIAARLEALAQPNGISISKSVYDLVVPKTKVSFNDLGVQKVKQNTFHAYDILLDPSQKRRVKSQSAFSTPLLASIAVLMVILLGGIFYFNYNTQVTDNNEIKELVKSDISKVLIKPFKFLSKRDDLSYVATGFTNHLGTSLSQHPQLDVVPETTANFIDKNEISNAELKSKYFINYSIEATIQVSGDQIRLSSKITDLLNEEVIASEVYELTEDEIFEYQDKITDLALQKMSTMDHSISSNQRVSQNPIIYKKFILAQANMVSWTPDEHYKAMKLIDEMLEIEPNNYGVKKLQGWLLQQKVYLGLSENYKSDIINSLEIAKNYLASHDINSIDAMALESSNEGLLGNYSEACSKVSRMNEILSEKKSKASSHSYAMTAWINQNCEQFEIANLTYEELFRVSPHYPAWVRYYYVYSLFALQKLDNAEKFINENKNLKYSYYGTNEIFQLCLVYIAHKRDQIELAKKYFAEYKEMPNSLSLDYLGGDFSAAKSKEFIEDFKDVLSIYGMT